MPATGRPGIALVPEPDTDQGDPYLLEVPAGERTQHPCRYYVFVTGTGFPVYGSNDLLDPAGWRRIGDSFPGVGADRWCWAPCVRHLPGLDRPWVMLYSAAAGAGELLGHQGHRIRRADSIAPAGPFRDSGEVLTADLDFAIDPDVRLASDGSSRLLFATDFVQDEPYGTGIVEARISSDLRRLESPPEVLARPVADWQLYQANRSMPWKRIPGVRWDRSETVRWSTVEGPAALESPNGRPVVLYSGGNYAGFYGIGVLARTPDGRWQDLSPQPADCLLAPRPDEGLYGPGHCSTLTTDGQSVLCYHFRHRPDGPRQFGILPLRWHPDTELPYLHS